MALFLFLKSAHLMQYELKQLFQLILLTNSCTKILHIEHVNLLKDPRDRSTILYSHPPALFCFILIKLLLTLELLTKNVISIKDTWN